MGDLHVARLSPKLLGISIDGNGTPTRTQDGYVVASIKPSATNLATVSMVYLLYISTTVIANNGPPVEGAENNMLVVEAGTNVCDNSVCPKRYEGLRHTIRQVTYKHCVTIKLENNPITSKHNLTHVKRSTQPQRIQHNYPL